MVLAIEIWPEFFVNVFLTDVTSEFMAFASRALRIFSISFLILGFNITNGGYLTAVAKPRFEFIITILRGYALVLAVSFIITNFMPKEYIWSTITISDFLTLIIGYFLIRIELKELNKLSEKARRLK